MVGVGNLVREMVVFAFCMSMLSLILFLSLVFGTAASGLSHGAGSFVIGNSHPEVFCQKGFLKNFAKFTGKHLRQSLFL